MVYLVLLSLLSLVTPALCHWLSFLVFLWQPCLCHFPDAPLHVHLMLHVSDRCRLHLSLVVFAAPTFRAKHSCCPGCLLTACILVGIVSLFERLAL